MQVKVMSLPFNPGDLNGIDLQFSASLGNFDRVRACAQGKLNRGFATLIFTLDRLRPVPGGAGGNVIEVNPPTGMHGRVNGCSGNPNPAGVIPPRKGHAETNRVDTPATVKGSVNVPSG